MNRRILGWSLLLAVGTATTLAFVHFGPPPAKWQALASPGPLSPGHAHLSNRCESCHEANVGVTAARCTACHASAEQLLGRQPTAFHASIEECAGCHLEHRMAGARPTTMDHAELARIGANTLARAGARDQDSRTTLQSLRAWLGDSAVERLDSAAARAALDCAGCHDRRDPHLARFGDDCALCHDTTAWTVPGYRHPSPRSRECVQCHEPPPSHRMGHFSMVSRRVAGKHATVEECFECHLTTSWNDIVGVGFYKHH